MRHGKVVTGDQQQRSTVSALSDYPLIMHLLSLCIHSHNSGRNAFLLLLLPSSFFPLPHSTSSPPTCMTQHAVMSTGFLHDPPGPFEAVEARPHPILTRHAVQSTGIPSLPQYTFQSIYHIISLHNPQSPILSIDPSYPTPFSTQM